MVCVCASTFVDETRRRNQCRNQHKIVKMMSLRQAPHKTTTTSKKTTTTSKKTTSLRQNNVNVNVFVENNVNVKESIHVKKKLRHLVLQDMQLSEEVMYTPASGSYSLRLLPALLLDMRSRDYQEDETGDPVIGALDIKDAFLQVAQERPLQISTSLGKYKYKVLKNLLGQRIGAIAWYERIQDYLISNQGPKPAYPCGRHHVHRPVKGGGKVCGRFEEGFPGGGHGSKEAWR